MSLSLLKSTVTSRKVFPPSPSPPHPSSAFAFALARRVISFSQFSSEQRVHFLPHVFIHANQRRPRAFEAFARNFLRRVNAGFAAAGDFTGGVVEHVGRAFGESLRTAIMLSRCRSVLAQRRNRRGRVGLRAHQPPLCPASENPRRATGRRAAKRRGGEGVAALGGGGARGVAGGGDERSAAAVPSEYLGQQAWRRRVEVLREASQQLRTFKSE